ncbi:MAG: metalloregulator ArsR/SmtB family transcription factor [Ornithinimicrobium sp.]
MNQSHDDLDEVWQALANPWRRRILDELRKSPRATGELTAALGADRHQLMAHLRVLRDSGLVVVEKRGRRRLNYLNPVPIGQIYQRWVSAYEASWTEALIGLKGAVETGHTIEGENSG